LNRRRCPQGAQGALESRHHTVTERLDHTPVAQRDGVGHVLDVGAANGVHVIVAEACEQRGRIDQVAEDDDCNPTHRTHPFAPQTLFNRDAAFGLRCESPHSSLAVL